MIARHVVGVDLGTTSVKAALYETTGQLISTQRWPLTTAHGSDGSATQDPVQWVAGVSRWLAQQPPLVAWAVGGQMNTYALADEAGKMLTNGITWQDRRRASGLPADEAFTSAIGRAMLFREIDEVAWESARWILLPKDVLTLETTGGGHSDSQSWNGILRDGDPSAIRDSARDALGGRVPALGSPTEHIDSRFGPLALGCPDTLASVLGCGLDDEAVYTISGTSESVAAHSQRKTPSGGVRNSVPLGGGWLHVAPSSVGGVTLEWAANLLAGGDIARLVSLAARVTPDAHTPLFGPYLAGERAPHWNPSLTGSWSGLRMSHTAADLAAAVLEGVAFAVRYSIHQTEKSAAHEGRRIVGQGGILHNATAAQMRADALERPLDVIIGADTTARGAASVAMASLSGESLQTSSQRFAAIPRTYHPRPNADVASRYEAWLETCVGSVD